MEIITDIFSTRLNKRTALAIGKFDGLHIGHRKLLQEILNKKAQGVYTCVFTFDPSPAVFFGKADEKELMTRDEKRRMLEALGVDILVEYPMTKESAAIEPERFVREILSEGLQVKYLVAGTDVSFGAKGAGNAQLLETLSEELDYELHVIEKVTMEGREISSSQVRSQVELGKMEFVEQLLGMPYRITGQVVHGRALGRKLGMPTLNLLPQKGKLLPPNGVYYSRVIYRDRVYCAISNIGHKPTVSEENIKGLETYLYDFGEEIYGEEVSVELLAYKRPEMRFESVEELKIQMQKDIMEGKEYHLGKRG